MRAYVRDLELGLAQGLGRAGVGYELEALFLERPGELDDAGLVRDVQEGAALGLVGHRLDYDTKPVARRSQAPPASA